MVYINNFFLIFDIFGGCSTRRFWVTLQSPFPDVTY